MNFGHLKETKMIVGEHNARPKLLEYIIFFDDRQLILSVKDSWKVLPSYPVCLCVSMDVDPVYCPV